jgi:hypothetical protein
MMKCALMPCVGYLIEIFILLTGSELFALNHGNVRSVDRSKKI